MVGGGDGDWAEEAKVFLYIPAKRTSYRSEIAQ